MWSYIIKGNYSMKNFVPIPFTDVELKDNFWSERLVINQKKL